jgi:diketogulonate reductase-like aldo/keto reductase
VGGDGKPSIVPIPGTTKQHRLEENIASVDVDLTAEDLREIDESNLAARGERYPESSQRMVDR